MLKKFLKAAKVIQKKHLQQFFTKEMPESFKTLH